MLRVNKLIPFLICAQIVVWGAHTDITLRTNSLVFSSDSGTGSVVVGASGEWTAITHSDWIHIDPGSETGASSGLLKFTYDSNSGPTRTGTIHFKHGHAKLTVTQAGVDYLATSEVTTLLSSNLSSPVIDPDGNVYFADITAGAIKKWTAATGQVTVLVSTGLKNPNSIAVSNSGDVYIADTGHNAIKKWTAATGQLTGLVFGLNQPRAVAVDSALNVYVADTGKNALEKWVPDSEQLSTLASSLNQPSGVAVDGSGNVYIADTGNKIVEKWGADTGQVTTVIPSGLNGPSTLSLDGAGDLYMFDAGTVKKWTAASGQLTTLFSPHPFDDFKPTGVGSDTAGNLSLIWSTNHVGHFPAFVGSAISAPGGDPVHAIYSSPSATDLAIDSLGNVYFNDFDVLGDSIVRKWSALTGQLTRLASNGLNARFRGLALNNAGDIYFTTDASLLSYPFGSIGKWIASTGQGVHLANDSNGEFPVGLAVNPGGDVYFADAAGFIYPPNSNDAIKKWTASTGQLTTLVPGLTNPDKVAIDAAGNVYFSFVYPSVGAIKEWEASTGTVSTLISASDTPQGTELDSGVAVDGSGDVYFSSGGAIAKRAAATGEISFLGPLGTTAAAIKLDDLNNIYALSGGIKKLTRAFVGPAAVLEPLSCGSDQLLPVLPAGTPLDGVSDQPWLTITSRDNGVVQFSFTSTTTPRRAHITVLGQTIPVTQTARW